MKLSEMKRLPKKAGRATLVFIDVNQPNRIQDRILLPKNPEAEFFLLQRRRQFLYREYSQSSLGIWFGGTDENPFLVQVGKEAFNAFKIRGEKGFYEALKPEVIKAIEKRFNLTSNRQGDIWAAPLPSYSWHKVNFIALLCSGEPTEPQSIKSESIFGTRHRLTGLYVDPVDKLLRLEEFPIPVFAEGIIEAPDHTPMKLEGVHVLAQTEYLVNPASAD